MKNKLFYKRHPGNNIRCILGKYKVVTLLFKMEQHSAISRHMDNTRTLINLILNAFQVSNEQHTLL